MYTIKRKLTDRPIRISTENHDKTQLRRFLDFDQKVLRFQAFWDDRESLFGEQRRFTLLYFLVNGSIELRQILPLNSGRDPTSRFLTKTQLPHPFEKRNYDDRDLRIGADIDVHGRHFLIYDADEWTKEFIDEKFGKQNWNALVVGDKKTYGKSERSGYPPYNGWGSEEDSLGFCNSLHPKPPRKDMVKLIEKEGHVLRFLAKFVDPQFQDKDRIFAICFYLADDTVSIFEKFSRNSGFASGRFLNRGKYVNEASGQYFAARDFGVGKTYVINKFHFTTYDADEYAMAYMESDNNQFPQSNLSDILIPLRGNQQAILALRTAFEKLDPELNGYVSSADAEGILGQFLNIDLHSARTIARRYTYPQGFDYFALVSVLG